MDVLWKGIVGGPVTAAIVFLSKRGNTLPGILPLFSDLCADRAARYRRKERPGRVPRNLPRRRQDDSRLSGLSGRSLPRRWPPRLPPRYCRGLAAWFVVALGIFLAPLRP
jgi:hypothetical protein